MAGENDSNRDTETTSPPSSRQWPDDENPFITFRRYADEQISSMLQSVTGLPSIVTPPRTDHWTILTEEQKYRDARTRQDKVREPNNDATESGDSSPTPGDSSSSRNSITKENRSPSEWSQSRWTDPAPMDSRHPRKLESKSSDLFDIDLFFDSFFDRFWFDDHVSSRYLHPYHRPLFANILSDDSPAWPVPYLMFSPYSPLHLERQAHYRSHRDQGVFSSLMTSLSLSSECDPDEPKWREAFEDLLRLENGKPMLDREQNAVTKRENGKEWLHGLVKRGSLGDQWKYIAANDSQPWSTITFDYHPNNSKRDQQYLPQETTEERELDEAAKMEGAWEASKPTPDTEMDMYERFLADIEAREREFFQGSHSPLLRFLLEDRQRRGNDTAYREQDHPNDDTENWLELVSGGKKNSVPDSSEETVHHTTSKSLSTPTTEESPSSLDKSYVISTQMSTERVRLPDGSIQTKTVKTRRFSDGREESNESVEVVNSPQRDQDSTEKEESSDQKKGGWFWKE